MYGNEEKSRCIIQSALFVALLAVGGWIAIPLGPVPFTLQSLFVLLAGAVMGRRGAIPVAIYLVLGAMNLPVFHNGLAGIGVLLGPSGGFLLGFVPAAYCVGIGYELGRTSTKIASLCVGTVVIYGCGVAWLMISTGMELWGAVLIGVVPFLIGDAIKIAAAFAIAEKIS